MHHPLSSNQAPATSGAVLHSVRFYDRLNSLLTLGRDERNRRQIIALAGVSLGASILDVGCGTGTLALVAKAAVGGGGHVSGIDASPEMIRAARAKAARRRVDVNLRVGTVEALPFPDASFDVVLSSLMLHHLPEDAKRQGFAEIARVLKPGGRFFAVDLATGAHFRGHNPRRHHTPGGLDSILPLLAEAGFAEVSRSSTTIKIRGQVLGAVSGRLPR